MAKANGLLVMNITYAWARQIDVVVVAASTISMLFWLFGLNRQSEETTVVIGHRWNREDQNKVLKGLKTLNSSLLRAGKS